jgi:MFS family permease
MTGPGEPPGRWRILAVLCGAVFLGMSLWFTASAAGAELAARWGLSANRAGWLTTIVQLGFVAGTAVAAFLNLADLLPLRTFFFGSALLAAAANGALAFAPGFESAIIFRFFTGFFLAGVYPPAMKMAASWFVAERGLAIGAVVGALTVGKAAPYLLALGGGGAGSLERVVWGASAAAVCGGVLVLLAYRDGPVPFDRRPFSPRLVGTVLRHRETRLVTLGYLGHMWELYPFWTVVGLYVAEHARATGALPAGVALAGALGAFVAISAGGPGALLAGSWADRVGRERIAILSLAVSGGCALCAGWLLAAPTPVVVLLILVWGFAVVADSAQFSALVTEVAPRHAVGTALTLQTSLGFLLTALTIWGTIELQARWGWTVAFTALGVGPLAGIVSMVRLARVRRRANGGASPLPSRPA